VVKPKGAVEVLARLVQLALPHQHEPEVVLRPGDRDLVVEQLVDGDRLLGVGASASQVAQVLVRAAKVAVHLAEPAEILQLACNVDRLRVVLDGLRPVVQDQVNRAEPADHARLERAVRGPQAAASPRSLSRSGRLMCTTSLSSRKYSTGLPVRAAMSWMVGSVGRVLPVSARNTAVRLTSPDATWARDMPASARACLMAPGRTASPGRRRRLLPGC